MVKMVFKAVKVTTTKVVVVVLVVLLLLRMAPTGTFMAHDARFATIACLRRHSGPTTVGYATGALPRLIITATSLALVSENAITAAFLCFSGAKPWAFGFVHPSWHHPKPVAFDE